MLHLIFMLPLPQFVYWKLTIFLQLVSSELGVWFVELMGIPVFLEGNVIDLGVYKLQVAEACSGLRYLFPILSFSYLFSILYRGPFWHKVVLFLMAAPLTVLHELLPHRDDRGSGQQLWHRTGRRLFALLRRLGDLWRLHRHPVPHGHWPAAPDPEPTALSETIDLDFEGFGGQARALPAHRRPRGLIVAALMSLAVSAAFVLTPAPPRVEVPARHSSPCSRASWATGPAAQQSLDPEIEQVLGADGLRQHDLFRRRARPRTSTSSRPGTTSRPKARASIRPRSACPSAAGRCFRSIRPRSRIPDTVYGTFKVNRAVIQKGLDKQLVYYWFEQRGKRMTNDYAAKASVVWDSLTSGRTDGALVRFVTPIEAGESEAEADARMQRFMALALLKLPNFIPE